MILSLDSFEERYGFKVIYAKAKSKEYGWRNLTQKVILENGKAYYETRDTSNFTKGYLNTNAYCRPSCYECKFKGFPRIADITIADFWGVESVNQSMEKNLGTSLVMINSHKGAAFFEKIKPRINSIEVPFDSILAGNPALVRPLDPPIVDREQFFEDVDKMTFTQLADAVKRIILSKHYANSLNITLGRKYVLKTLSFLKHMLRLMLQKQER